MNILFILHIYILRTLPICINLHIVLVCQEVQYFPLLLVGPVTHQTKAAYTVICDEHHAFTVLAAFKKMTN